MVVDSLHRQNPHLVFKLAVASRAIKPYLQIDKSAVPIELVDDSRELMANAHASLVASGTVSLEHAMMGTPYVVMYKFSWVSYLLMQWLIKKKIDVHCHGFISLPNILAKKEICPEFVQNRATVTHLVKAIASILENSSRREQIEKDFFQLQSQLKIGHSTAEALALILQNK